MKMTSDLINVENTEVNFKKYFDLVKQDKILWEVFVSVLDDLSISLVKSKQLISLLLDEFKDHRNCLLKNSLRDSLKDEGTQTIQAQLDLVSQESQEIVNQPEHLEEEVDDQEIKEPTFAIRDVDEIEDESYESVVYYDYPPNDTEEVFKNHIDDKKLKCDSCSKSFSSKITLKRHLKRVHPEEKIHQCFFCLKTFKRRCILTKHEKIHMNKPIECDTCDERFANIFDLEQHKRLQVDDKKLKCDLCTKTFKHFNTLKRHERIHTKEKPYECSICFKRFARSDALSDHEKNHMSDKPFECNICGEVFGTSRSLRNHNLTHY